MSSYDATAATRRRPPARRAGCTTATSFVDPYEWLRDKQDPDVIAYLEAENAYTERRTGHLRDLTDAIFAEIKARTQETDLSVPTYAHARATAGGATGTTPARSRARSTPSTAAGRRRPTDRHPPERPERDRRASRCCWTATSRPPARTSSPSARSPCPPTAGCWPTPPTSRGDERFTLRVKDLSTGELLPDAIETPPTAWPGPATSHLFYTRADEAWRPVRGAPAPARHRARRPTSTCSPSRDERFWVGVELQPGRRLDRDRRRQQAHLRVPAAARRRPRGRAAGRRAAPPGRGVRRRARRRPAADRAQRRRRGLRAGRGAAGRHQPRAVEAGAPPPAGRPDHRRERVRRPRRRLAAPRRADRACTCSRATRGGGLRRRAPTSRSTSRSTASTPPAGRTTTPTRSGSATTSMVTPGSVYDYDLDTGELTLLKQTPVLDDPTSAPYAPSRLRPGAGLGHRRRRHPGTDLDRPPGGRAAGRLRAGAALRLRLVRDLDRPDLLDPAAVAAGPRLRLRHRPRPRRRRAGPRLVRARARR